MRTILKLLQPDCHMSDSGSYKVGEVCTSGSNLLSTLHKTGSTSIVLVMPRLLIPWTTPTLHISDGCRLPDSGCNQAAHHRQKNWYSRIVLIAVPHMVPMSRRLKYSFKILKQCALFHICETRPEWISTCTVIEQQVVYTFIKQLKLNL